MKEQTLLQLCVRYREIFQKHIPNEPTWPLAVIEHFEEFERLLEKSVAEQKDYLTQTYGEDWNALSPDYDY